MKEMIIFDPAMCCSTGVCGPSVDKNLLRVASVINNLKSKGVIVERHNLSSNPQAFVDNSEINRILNTEGVEALPVTLVDGEVVKKGSYPSNREFIELLEIPESYLQITIQKAPSCGCKDGCC